MGEAAPQPVYLGGNNGGEGEDVGSDSDEEGDGNYGLAQGEDMIMQAEEEEDQN